MSTFRFALSTPHRPSYKCPHLSPSMSFRVNYPPFVFILLRTPLHQAKRYLPSFLSLAHSWEKTPGVGGLVPSVRSRLSSGKDGHGPHLRLRLILRRCRAAAFLAGGFTRGSTHFNRSPYRAQRCILF